MNLKDLQAQPDNLEILDSLPHRRRCLCDRCLYGSGSSRKVAVPMEVSNGWCYLHSASVKVCGCGED